MFRWSLGCQSHDRIVLNECTYIDLRDLYLNTCSVGLVDYRVFIINIFVTF